MGKHKGKPEIGHRMVEELHRIFGTVTDIARNFDIERSQIYNYAGGVTPGGYELAKLYNCGGDVIYVLTGKRGAEDGK